MRVSYHLCQHIHPRLYQTSRNPQDTVGSLYVIAIVFFIILFDLGIVIQAVILNQAIRSIIIIVAVLYNRCCIVHTYHSQIRG